MFIIKFGGSSVGSVENLHRVKSILTTKQENFVVVVSAFSGVTNQLEELGQMALNNDFSSTLEQLKERHISTARQLIQVHQQTNILIDIQQQFLELKSLCESIYILGELSTKTNARILSKGELLSSKIIHEFLRQSGIQLNYLPAWELIKAQGNHLNASVEFEATNENLMLQINQNQNYIAPGFVATNFNDEIVVLGRGGSDFTASIIGATVNAGRIELWSDVNGMQNANPRLVKQAKVIHQMSYEEAFEMSYFGAKVVYPPAIKPAMKKSIPVLLKNTLRPEDGGTAIVKHNDERKDKVLGVSTLSDISVINVSGIGLAGRKGSARKIFQALEIAGVNVILITQSCSEQSICICVKTSDQENARNALNQQFKYEIQSNELNPIEITDHHVILALVGDNMKHQVGLSGKIFGALGENNVNVKAIAQGASERNISVVIDANDEHKAVNVIHERFFQEATKKVHLFVIGVGNVGKQFLDILYNQQKHCKQEYNIDLRVVSVANSKQFLFDEKGLSPQETNQLAERGEVYSELPELIERIRKANLRNSIVIDNTASTAVSEIYPAIFDESISIATCNKIATSSPLENYLSLLQKAKDKNAYFQYETAVGAALPVIKTIQNLRLSGDMITQIQAVLSGSLNFIFNNYDGIRPFHEIVKQAQDEGYTEPDPRIDLSGLDVIRKILILAREAGYQKEMEEVKFNSFLPEKAMQVETVEQFYEVLKENEDYFRQMLFDARAKNAKLKVIAQLKDNEMNVSLNQVMPDSPFYQLDGKDNIVSLNTQLYNQEPLIVKGAGAGAKVTASGVFSDLMYIVNQQ